MDPDKMMLEDCKITCREEARALALTDLKAEGLTGVEAEEHFQERGGTLRRAGESRSSALPGKNGVTGMLVTCPTFCSSRIVSVVQSTDKLTRRRRRRGCGNCMVRRQIASRIFWGEWGWSAQMYPACLWSNAPGHNGVRAPLV